MRRRVIRAPHDGRTDGSRVARIALPGFPPASEKRHTANTGCAGVPAGFLKKTRREAATLLGSHSHRNAHTASPKQTTAHAASPSTGPPWLNSGSPLFTMARIASARKVSGSHFANPSSQSGSTF